MIRFCLLSLVLLAGTAHADTRLIMFDQPGCVWCERWTADIGTEYPKTAEGKAAPLTRIGLRAPLPEDLELASRPTFTPTFVLVHDGQEVARIEGYPGEDFFWGLLARMIDTVPDTAKTPETES